MARPDEIDLVTATPQQLREAYLAQLRADPDGIRSFSNRVEQEAPPHLLNSVEWQRIRSMRHALRRYAQDPEYCLPCVVSDELTPTTRGPIAFADVDSLQALGSNMGFKRVTDVHFIDDIGVLDYDSQPAVLHAESFDRRRHFWQFGAPARRPRNVRPLDFAIVLPLRPRTNYHYTLLDLFPVLLAAMEIFGDGPFVVPAGDPDVIDQLVSLVGGDASLLIHAPSDLHLNEAVLVRRGTTRTHARQDVRRRLIESVEPRGEPLVYVSRRRISDRPLANEPELESALAELGFDIVAPEQLPVREQLRRLAAAEMVVAPHGAALANLVVSRDDVELFEMFPPNYRPSVYQTVRRDLDLAWTHHRLTGLNGDGDTWTMPLDSLLPSVESAVQQRIRPHA